MRVGQLKRAIDQKDWQNAANAIKILKKYNQDDIIDQCLSELSEQDKQSILNILNSDQQQSILNSDQQSDSSETTQQKKVSRGLLLTGEDRTSLGGSEEEKKSLFIYDWKKEYELKDGKVMGWCEYFEEEMVTKVENEYDDQGRLVCELQYYSEGDSWEEKTVYEYDSRGNLIRECKYDEMCGSNSYPTTTYQYDNLNRMIGKQCLWFDDVCKKELDSLTYSYNENGKFKEIIHSSWSFTPWAEEGSGDCRLDYIYVYSYDENGLVTQMLGWHNGELEVVERYFYDEMDNLVRKEHDDLLYPRQNWLIFRKIEYY